MSENENADWKIGPLQPVENLLQRDGIPGVVARLAYAAFLGAVMLFLLSDHSPIGWLVGLIQ